MNSSTPKRFSSFRSQKANNCQRKNEFLESAAYDEYAVFQTARTLRKPLMLCVASIRVIPSDTTIIILWMAILILGAANKVEAQVPLKINLKTEAVDGTIQFGSQIQFRAT